MSQSKTVSDTSDDACTCSDPDVVVTQDRNMSLPYVSGNAYCRYCRNCGRRYFCKKSFWQNIKEKFVIPMNGSEPEPVEDYDDENYFECPKCDHPHFGEPDSCENCGAEYEWGSE